MARELIATPPAPCRWAKLLEPNGYPAYDESSPNEWSVELIFDTKDKEHAEFLLQCENLYDKYHDGARKSAYWLPIRDGENEDKGKSIVRFKTKARTFKDGRTASPPVVEDTNQRDWDKSKLLGNGSVLRVAFDVYAWKSPSGSGLTFQPKIVQVVEHSPYVEGSGGQVKRPF